MNYLTNFYKNKFEQLQEHYNFLLSLYEGIEDMTDDQIETWVKGNAQNPEQAEAFRQRLRDRRERARTEKQSGRQTGTSQETREAERQAENTRRQQQGAENSAKQNEERARRQAQADEVQRQRANSAEEQARQARQAEEAAARKTTTEQPKQAEPPKAPPPTAETSSSGIMDKVKGVAGAVGRFLMPAGVAMTPGIGTVDLARKGMQKAGIENEQALETGSNAIGWGTAEGIVSGGSKFVKGGSIMQSLATGARAFGPAAAWAAVLPTAMEGGAQMVADAGEAANKLTTGNMSDQQFDEYMKKVEASPWLYGNPQKKREARETAKREQKVQQMQQQQADEMKKRFGE